MPTETTESLVIHTPSDTFEEEKSESKKEKEEKTQEPVVPKVFTPHRSLTDSETYFFLYLMSISTIVKRLQTGVFPNFPPRPPREESDEDNALLIQPYDQFIDLFKISQAVKSGTKPIEDLITLFKSIHTTIENIKNHHPLLFQDMLTKTAGRHGLLYILFNRIIHNEPETDITRALIKILLKSSPPSVDGIIGERDVLEYLELVLNRQCGIPDPQNEPTNPLIKIQFIFESQKTVDEKIEEIKKLIENPLKFDKKVPSFLTDFISYNFTHGFISKEIALRPTTIFLFMPYINALATKGYFPPVLQQIVTQSLPHFVLSMFNFLNCFEVYTYHYTLINHPKATLLHSQFNAMLYDIILLFNNINNCSAIKHETLKDVIKSFTCSSCDLIRHGYVNSLGKEKFYQAIVNMCSFLTLPSGSNSSQDYFLEINKMIDLLSADEKKYEDMIYLLSFFNTKQDQFQNDKKKYLPLLSVIHFMHDMHELNIQMTLENIKNNKYDFKQLDKKLLFQFQFQFLPIFFKTRLIRDIASFIEKMRGELEINNFLIPFQNLVLELATALDVTSIELETIKENIDFNDDEGFLKDPFFNEEEKKLSARSSKKSKKQRTPKPATATLSIDHQLQKLTLRCKNEDKNTNSPIASSTPVSAPTVEDATNAQTPKKNNTENVTPTSKPSSVLVSQSIFKETKDIYVGREKLPNMLTQLSDDIHSLTKQDLIVSGGAITELALKSNKEPNDYDGFVCFDKEELFSLLMEKGYDCVPSAKADVNLIEIVLARPLHEKETNLSLLSIQDEKELTQALLEKSQRNNTPILINKKDEYSLYGYKNRHWQVTKLTRLSNNEKQVIKALMEGSNFKTPLILKNELTGPLLEIVKNGHEYHLDVDITCDKTIDQTSHRAMERQIFKKKDFKLSAVYMRLSPQATRYKVKEFDGAIDSIQKKLISLVNPEDKFNDLNLIYRLAKIRLKHDDFKPDAYVQGLINDPAFPDDFDKFIYEDQGKLTHLRQINTHLNKLFFRFDDTKSVLEMLCELKIISGMTGITHHKHLIETANILDSYIKTLPKSDKKLAFYYFIYMHFCLSPDDKNKKQLLDKVKQTLEPRKEAPDFQASLDYIQKSISGQMLPKGGFKPSSEFLTMLTEMKIYYKSHLIQNVREKTAQLNTAVVNLSSLSI